MESWSAVFVNEIEAEGKIQLDRSSWTNLVTSYQREEQNTTPLPWERNALFIPEDQIGDLTSQVLDPTGTFVSEDPCTLEDLFDVLFNRTSGRPRRILIRGHAGFGKTTLCKKLVRDWVSSDEYCPGHPTGDTLLVYYKLRDLREGKDLTSELLTFIQSGHSPVESMNCSVQEAIGRYGNRVILLLDGYNELGPAHQEQVVQLLKEDTDSVLRHASVVLTARPELQESFLVLFDYHFVLHGLSDPAAEAAVRKYYQNSESDVTFILSKFKNILQAYKMSPLLLAVLCYLQKIHYKGKVEAIENAIYQCALEVSKRALPQESGLNVNDKQSQRHLLTLGKLFLRSLLEKKFRFTTEQLEQYLPSEYGFAASAGLFRKIGSHCKLKHEMECIHTSFMEVLATYYVEDFWYTLPNDRLHYFPHLHSFEVFAFRDTSEEVNFKVIGENRGVGFFVWDFMDGSCVFSTYLNKSSIPRKMGDCTLNVNFTVPFTDEISKENLLSMMSTLFPGNCCLPPLSELVLKFEILSAQLNFLVNDEFPLCPSIPRLLQARQEPNCEANHWRDIRDAAYEINLTFLGTGCNHRYITVVLDNLMDLDLCSEKESNTATELLTAMKKHDNADTGYVCLLAAVANTGRYYFLDTKRRTAFEDLRPWSQRTFFKPNYSWNMVDLFVVTYQSLLQDSPTD